MSRHRDDVPDGQRPSGVHFPGPWTKARYIPVEASILRAVAADVTVMSAPRNNRDAESEETS